MQPIIDFLKGKKAYITAVLIGVGSVLQYYGIAIPEYVWTLLAAVGLGTVRAAISKK